MNSRAAVISLLLVLSLAGATVFLLRPAPPPAGPAATWLSSLDTIPVRRLEFRSGGRVEVEIARRGAEWFVIAPQGSRPDWPADESRVRGLLRLLAAVAHANAEPTRASPAESLTIVPESGEARTLAAVASVVGGTASLITLDDPTGAVARPIDPAMASAMSPGAVLATWSRHAAFPASGQTISRIRVETQGALLELARAGGGWNVLLPRPTPGAREACEQLAAVLSQLGAVRFVGVPDAQAATWARSPTALIEIESGTPGDATRRLVQELRIGGAADASAATLMAQATSHWVNAADGAKTVAWGPMVLTVDRAAIEAIHPDLAAFAARESVRSALADVGGVWLAACGTPEALSEDRPLTPPRKEALATSEFSHVGFVRTLDGWKKVTTGTTGAMLGDAESKLLGVLLKTLCESPAAGIAAERPKEAVCAGVVVLTDAGGAPLAMVAVGATKAAGGGSLVVRSGRLWRTYAGPNTALVAGWIAELLAEAQGG